MIDPPLELLLILRGVLVGSALALAVVTFVAYMSRKRTAKGLAHMRGLLAALENASDNAQAAAQRGDCEAWDEYEAEFWALSAELDWCYDQSKTTNHDKHQTDGGA